MILLSLVVSMSAGYCVKLNVNFILMFANCYKKRVFGKVTQLKKKDLQL